MADQTNAEIKIGRAYGLVLAKAPGTTRAEVEEILTGLELDVADPALRNAGQCITTTEIAGLVIDVLAQISPRRFQPRFSLGPGLRS